MGSGLGYLADRLGINQPSDAEREQLILTLRDSILRRCSPQQIIVFGSVLGKAFTHASDLDCAVIFADRVSLNLGRKKLYCAPSLIDYSVDLLLYEQTEFLRKAGEGGICQVIQETGRGIYDQKSEI